MVYLPEEIVEEILSRLSVKSLLRFRCVSKSWLAIISSPYFIKLHLNRSVQTKSNLSLFLRNSHLFRVDFDSLKDGDVLQPVEIDYFTSRYPYHQFSICGSCDGLLCITLHHYIDAVINVFLWNSSTKKSIQLPHVTTAGKISSGVLGFCYDKTNNDYKVVKHLHFKVGEIIEYEIKVYSLKSNSWHSPKNFPYDLKLWNIEDSITCGAMHWISNVGSENKIVAFDFGTEKYRVIPLPEISCSHSCLYLNNFEGCLSATGQYHSSNMITVDIFLLKEYGEKNEHWSKLFTISPPFSTLFHTVKPIAYSKCGKKVLFQTDYKRLAWYNLEQKSDEKIRIYPMEYFSEVYTYMESMVSFDVLEDVRVNQV